MFLPKTPHEALNVVIHGLLAKAKGGNVVTTSLEHNAVARPLRYICETNGIELRIAACDNEALIEPLKVQELVDEETRAIFCKSC